MAPVRELEGATLHEFNAGEAYSSKRMRLEVTTMGTLITTIVRKSLGTDAASNRSVTYQWRPSVEPFWFPFPDSVGLDFTKCTESPHGACVRAVRRANELSLAAVHGTSHAPFPRRLSTAGRSVPRPSTRSSSRSPTSRRSAFDSHLDLRFVGARGLVSVSVFSVWLG